MAAFGARVEIIFAHILVFPACAIEVQHINENSPTILQSFSFTVYKGAFQKSELTDRTVLTMVRPDVLAMK